MGLDYSTASVAAPLPELHANLAGGARSREAAGTAFCTSSPANRHSRNSVFEVKIKSTGYLQTKYFIFEYDIIYLPDETCFEKASFFKLLNTIIAFLFFSTRLSAHIQCV